MELFIKISAGVLIATVLSLILNRQGKEFTILLTVSACSLILVAGLAFVEPVLTFLEQLAAMGSLNSDAIKILIKITGISLITEIVGMVCVDAGNNSLGKVLQILSSIVILRLSLPLMSSLMDVIKEILGRL